MTIKEKINADFIEAYKAKEMKKKDFLGVIKGAIQTQESKADFEANDTGYLKIINIITKGVKENLELRKSTGYDTSEQELELSYLIPYQPELMSESVIREKVRLIIIETGKKNLGYIMGTFTKENNGVAFDNKTVSDIIREELL